VKTLILSILALIIGIQAGISLSWIIMSDLAEMNKECEVGRYVLHNGKIWEGGARGEFSPVILKIDTKTGDVGEYCAGVADGEPARGWWDTNRALSPLSKKDVEGLDKKGGEK
jgi:hypothetical protein